MQGSTFCGMGHAMDITLSTVMNELAAKGTASTRNTHLRHGAVEPLFGVKVGDLKPLQKLLKGRQDLAMELYATKNSDAMYLAGLIANGALMTPRQLDTWAATATWHMIAGYTVPWVAAEHAGAFGIAAGWIDSGRELIATAGWSTLACLVTTTADASLPLPQLEGLLDRCSRTIKSAPNRVRAAMNGFIIACGTYVAPLGERAIATARKIGAVPVDVGDTSCQVPDAESSILKARRGAPAAPKRKTCRC